jgi:hypothetical protein
MYTRSPTYITVLLVPAIVVIAACGNHDSASPTAPGAVTSALVVAAEPMTATPEFTSISFCPAAPSFGVRLLITISGNGDIVILQRLRFAFTDRFGGFAVPVVTQTSTALSGGIPTSMPVPLPTSPSIPIPGASPIPIPGSLPVEELRIQAGVSGTLPVLLNFGCGVPADGTLVVSVDTTDMRGRSSTSQVRVRVGG